MPRFEYANLMRRRLSHIRVGQIPLKLLVVLAVAVAVALIIWISLANREQDNRRQIICWGITFFGEDIYSLVHQFEKEWPEYQIVISSSVERDLSSDGQRLLTSIAGGVPPDVVFFPRHATGEWASRNALIDLRPLIENQAANDPYRIDLKQYYDWAINEASYRPPGTDQQPGIYGIPTTGDIRVLYVNTDLLRQAELVDPDGKVRIPRTWDELRDDAKKLTIYRIPGDKTSGIARLGFAPNFGNSWLYLYAWQAGGEFLSADGTRVTMNSPGVVRALRFMSEVYDDLGGVAHVNAFQQSLQTGDLDPFLKNLVAMKIDNDYALRTIADWRPDMDFVIAPAPMPADRLAAGEPPVTWAGGFSLVIPSTSKNKDGAFKFIQYLTSWQGTQLLEQGKREQKESEGRLYLPEGLANRVYFERLVQQHIFDNPRVPQPFKNAYAVLKELMPRTRYRPVTPVGQLLWNQHVRAYEAAVGHAFADEAQAEGVDEAQYSLSVMQREVQRQLDEILRPPPPNKVNWTPWFFAYGVLVSLPLLLMWFLYRRRRREYGYRAHEVAAAMLFIAPWVLGMIVFVGGPILFSIIFSFTRYDVLSPARYVAADNYRDVFSDSVFYKSIWNTLFMLLRVPLAMAVGLAMALLLNRQIRAIGIYRTSFFMPVIVPLVASSLLWYWLFNPGYGALNRVLAWVFDSAPFEGLEWVIGRMIGSQFQFALPLWLHDQHWSKPSLILMSLWTAGGGMIIWLAGLQSIPPQLYEAASIDGAGAWRRFRHVTIPMLSPYILFNLIIGMIATMQIFAEAYIMTQGGPLDSTLFYAYYLFKQAFQYFRMGYASALAWILFLIVLGLTLTQLWLSRRWVHYEQT